MGRDIKLSHIVNDQHCYVLQEEPRLYEIEPDRVINLTRLACGRGLALCLSWPLFYSLPGCHWARVMLRSREVAAGPLRLVNALTGWEL